MKPFYNLGYNELFASLFKLEGLPNRRVLFYYAILAFFVLFAALFFVYNINTFVVLMMFAVCVMSMLPLRLFPWLAAPDLNTLLTVYATMQYGLPAGLFIGNASTLGIFLSGDPDNNILFDFAAGYTTAIIPVFFSMQHFVPVVVACATIYFVLAIAFHYFFGTMDFVNMSWTITNLIWTLFIVYQLIPLLHKFFFFA